MYYYEDDTKKVYGPFIDFEEVKRDFEEIRTEIPDYNVWDFAVTLNMIYSDHMAVMKKWTKGEKRLEKRMVKLAISWLNDEDTNHPTDKIFWYMNS